MDVLSFLTPRVGTVGVPPGEPEALRTDAGKLRAVASRLAAEVSGIRALVASVVDRAWFGLAAMGFRGKAMWLAGEVNAAPAALEEAAGALDALADGIQAAQETARSAKAAAAELDVQAARLDAAYAEALTLGPEAAALPGLIAEAARLRFDAAGISSQAGSANEMFEDAHRRAAAAFQHVQQMAPSVQRALAAERAAAEEEGDGEPGGLVGLLYDGAKPFRWAADKGEDVVRGAWNGVAEPVGAVVDLVNPFDADGFFGDWANLGKGVWYGVTHPVEFGKALIGVDVWREHGFAYWAGNLIPTAVAAFFTGGGSTGLRGASAASKIVKRADDVLDVAGDAAGAGRVVKNVDELDDAVDLDAIRARADAEGRKPQVDGIEGELKGSFEGPATVFSGRLKVDLELEQFATEGGSMKWWTTPEEAAAITTREQAMQRFALLPEWGERVSVRSARIPAGTDVTFVEGKAKGLLSELDGVRYEGGGTQFRFLDFDEDWIVSTRPFPPGS